MDVTGSCHCGEVQFEATIDPRRVGICHCKDCQIFGSAPFRTSALVMGDQLRLVRGKPALYLKTAQSGNQRSMAFCNHCGTHLYASPASGDILFYSVRVGVLSHSSELRPVSQLWCQSELPWLSDLPNLPRIEQQ